MTLYIIDVAVNHRVEVEAGSIEEAEQLAYEEFCDSLNDWDEVGIYLAESLS